MGMKGNKMNTSYEAVKAALIANYGWVVDDERAAKVPAIDKSPLKVAAIVKAGESVIALLPQRVIHQLFKLYVDDGGTVHLSTESANANIAIGIRGSIADSVSGYNSTMRDEDPTIVAKLTDLFLLEEEAVA